ncbi:hypothetical protein EVAR_13792_1 [Eumeta japonica]|uniref:Uncharacterized protein n=1 Tax=Eumeta variegata TaxID=151549 RepID=A0A4C1U2G6_EUMVA|nr:hypothetical protein EVAR_13792_1 [Eumeta japonica]
MKPSRDSYAEEPLGSTHRIVTRRRHLHTSQAAMYRIWRDLLTQRSLVTVILVDGPHARRRRVSRAFDRLTFLRASIFKPLSPPYRTRAQAAHFE